MESTKGLQIRLREDEPIEVCELVHRLEVNLHSKSVRAILSGSELVFPRDKSEPSSALLMRRAYLARRAEEREYDKMVASIQKKPIPPDQSLGTSLRFQATVSLNMIVAPVASFFVTYLAARSISKDVSTVRFESLNYFFHSASCSALHSVFLVLSECSWLKWCFLSPDHLLSKARLVRERDAPAKNRSLRRDEIKEHKPANST